MAQPSVFQRGAAFRRRIARALVLVVGAGLVAWVGLVATAVVPNGGSVELPDFVAPLQRAVAPATSTPARGDSGPAAATPTPAPRPALAIPPLPFFPTPTPTPTLSPATPAPTPPGGGPPATFPGRTPERTPRTSPPGR